MVQDFPRFMVLLFALQRFRDEDWGIGQMFKIKDDRLTVQLKNEEGVVVDLNFGTLNAIYHRYALTGRATTVVPVRSDSPDPRDVTQALTGVKMVMKVSHPADSRKFEWKTLGLIHKIAKDNTEVRNHIPEGILRCRLEETCTSLIRQELNLPPRVGSGRTMQIILFPEYRPITELTGLVFWDAFWDCVVCRCSQASITNGVD